LTEKEGELKAKEAFFMAASEKAALIEEEVGKLPVEIRRVLRPKVTAGSKLAAILDAVTGPDLAVEPTSAEVDRFVPQVMKLFDPNAAVRGNAYKAFTTGNDRSKQALLDALLAVGRSQSAELRKLDGNSTDPRIKAEVSRLRRGLENVVVTIRDMSRSVSKVPPANREKVLAFAEELISLSFGVGEEAGSLKRWLTNGTY
jgi:hypothetical protein